MGTAFYLLKKISFRGWSHFNLRFIFLFFVIFQAIVSFGEETRPSPDVGTTVRREISAGETQSYSIEVKTNEVVRFKFEKKDLRFVFNVSDPAGKLVFSGNYQRYESVEPWFIGSQNGTFRFEITSLESAAAHFGYSFQIVEKRLLHRADLQLFEAERKFQRAEELRSGWAAHSLESAINLYDEAASIWFYQNERQRLAIAFERIGEVYLIFGDYQNSLKAYRQALAFSQKSGGDNLGKLRQYCSIARVNILTGDFPFAERNLSVVKRSAERLNLKEDSPLRATLFTNLGELAYAKGDLNEARRFLEQALKIWQNLNDRRGEAETLLNLGYTNFDAGEIVRAEQELDLALSLWREVGDLRGEAFTLTVQGHVRSFFREWESALKLHSDVQKIFEFIGDRQGEAVALNGMGYVYEVLNRPASAVSAYHQAFEINKKLGNEAYLALTSFALARSYRLQKNFGEAEKYYEESQKLCRKLNKPRIEAYIYSDLAKIRLAVGDKDSALRKYNQTLSFYKKIGDLRGEALILAEIGDVYQQIEKLAAAEESYRSALDLNRRIGDQTGISDVLYRLAEVEFKREDLPAALQLIDESISLADQMREKLRSPTLRSAYGATNRNKIELEIDIIMQMREKNPQNPQPQLIAEALEKVEASRARTLLEILAETRIDPRTAAVDPQLLKREKEIQNKLAVGIDREISLRYTASALDELEKTKREIDSLTAEYDRLQTSIKTQDPRYEKLVAPRPVHVADIQFALRNEPDTIYLSYFLGARKSYVWLVDQTEVKVFELDKRSDLENSAREVYGQLTARQKIPGESSAEWQERVRNADQSFCGTGEKLSRQLFGQLAPLIAGKRLLISLDGALEYVPLEALPSAAAAPSQVSSMSPICSQTDEAFNYTPVLETNEIAYVPSFSVLLSLRNYHEEETAPSSGDQLAIWADPVYESDDPRLSDKLVQSNASLDNASLDNASGFREDEPLNFPVRRLLNTQLEAKEVADLWAKDKVSVFTGLAANREKILSGNWADYRFLHFAAHGFFDNAHPENSGLMLSRFDENGGRDNGFLSLQDIFQMRLNADLVVLSACQTGLGEQFSGEGISGLKYAFFYAGAKSAMVSLWQVDDQATAALMRDFYRAFLEKGLPASAALRSAKLEMYRQKGWRHPFYWAAFALNGEYRIGAPEKRSFFLISNEKFLILVSLIAVLLVFYLFKRKIALLLKFKTK